jgi:hypothetical protein
MNNEVSKEVLKQQGDAILFAIDVLKKKLDEEPKFIYGIQALERAYERDYKIVE